MQFIKKIIKPKNFLKIISSPHLVLIHFLYALKRFCFDIKFIFVKKYKYNIIFIAGMPMSATTKVKNMCGMIPGYFSRYTPMPYEIALKQDISESAFRYTPKWSYSLFKTHLNPNIENIKIIKKKNVKKVVVTYRDLRDVVIARYHRLVNFPKNINDPLFAEYHMMKKSDAIDHCIEVVSKNYIIWKKGWEEISESEPNFVLFIKFEDLILDPEKEFSKILNFYEINLSKKLIKNIIENTKGRKDMISNINESKILPWAMSSNFRSGKIGNWKNEFSDENLSKAKLLLGKNLIDQGYEKNLNW